MLGVLMVIIGGPSSPKLSERIACILGESLVPVEHKVFPDGEVYIRIHEEIKNKTVILVQSFYPQNKGVVEFLLMADLCLDLGASEIIAVVPYLAYMRQDKRFREGEAISAKTILKLLQNAGVKRLITCDIHNPNVLSWFSGKAVNLMVAPLLAKFVAKMNVGDLVVVAPDEGAIERAKAASEVLNAEYAVIHKERDYETGEIKMDVTGVEVTGKSVLLIDDMISTGGTIALAAKKLKEFGAKKIYAACTHGLFVGDAVNKIMKAGVEQIISTDTIEGKFSFVSVAEPIAEALQCE